jgi:hypothetical protein
VSGFIRTVNKAASIVETDRNCWHLRLVDAPCVRRTMTPVGHRRTAFDSIFGRLRVARSDRCMDNADYLHITKYVGTNHNRASVGHGGASRRVLGSAIMARVRVIGVVAHTVPEPACQGYRAIILRALKRVRHPAPASALLGAASNAMAASRSSASGTVNTPSVKRNCYLRSHTSAAGFTLNCIAAPTDSAIVLGHD